jgi:hypothetical protein
LRGRRPDAGGRGVLLPDGEHRFIGEATMSVFEESWFTCRPRDGTPRTMQHQVDAVDDIVGLWRAIDRGQFDAVIAASIATVETRACRELHMEDLVQITEQGPLLLSTALDKEHIFEI